MEPAAGSSRWHSLVSALLVALAVAAFVPALDVFLGGDDFEWLDASYDIVRHPLSSFELINRFFRPLVKWSYLADYLAFGHSGFGYMLTNIAIHFLNALLLGGFLKRRLRHPLLAAGAAAAFALSPLHSGAVLWAAGRPDTLLLTCWIGSLSLLDRWAGHPTAVLATSWIGVALLGVGAKGSWIVFPFLVTAYAAMVLRRPIAIVVRLTAALWMTWAVYLGVLLLRPALSAAPSAVHYADFRLLPALVKTSSTLLAYCGLGWMVPEGWASVMVAAVIGVGAAVWSVRRGDRFGQWALLWLGATLALAAPFEVAVLRHNYLPLVGFWMVIATFTDRLLVDRPTARPDSAARRPAVAAVAVAVGVVVVTEAVLLQLEIGDYRFYGDLHLRLCRSYARVEPEIPRDRPIVFIDRASFRGVDYAVEAVQGCDKTYFVRRDAIWQLVFLEPLANFMGRPFDERLQRLVAVPSDLGVSDPTVLIVDDTGFALRPELQAAVVEAVSTTGDLPQGVGLYRFTAD